ncbi:MAG: 50S ribosomal protein L18 [Candidatus Vidania fulgoroideorum]
MKKYFKKKLFPKKNILSIYKTNKHFYIQILSKDLKRIIVSSSTNEKIFKNKKNIIKKVIKNIYKKAKIKNIKKVIFNCRKYKFTGNIKIAFEYLKKKKFIYINDKKTNICKKN